MEKNQSQHMRIRKGKHFVADCPTHAQKSEESDMNKTDTHIHNYGTTCMPHPKTSFALEDRDKVKFAQTNGQTQESEIIIQITHQKEGQCRTHEPNDEGSREDAEEIARKDGSRGHTNRTDCKCKACVEKKRKTRCRHPNLCAILERGQC